MWTRDQLLSRISEDPGLAALHAFAQATMDDDPGHDLAHCLRVALWTVAIGSEGPGQAGEVDWREAVAAALLHDIINVPKDSAYRHRASEVCAEVARRELPRFGFAREAVERIADAVRDHSFSRGAVPTTPLGCALQDADRLEALGVIGLFRCISTGVRMGARYFHDTDPFATDRPLDDKAFSIDHFAAKLLGLPTTMRTEAGRIEAERRAEVLRKTLTDLAIELGQPITADAKVRP